MFLGVLISVLLRVSDLFFLVLNFLRVFVMLFFCVSANAQKLSLTGVVRDAVSGEPILGANILEKGTTNGTITNLDGEFSLTLSPNATLVVKYVGYQPQEIQVAGQKNLIIKLQEDAVVLGEVVAIGYATVKKNDATGSITAIKPDKLNKGLTTNAQDMITGKIAVIKKKFIAFSGAGILKYKLHK
jgi:iron complex outermembrane receptor protein